MRHPESLPSALAGRYFSRAQARAQGVSDERLRRCDLSAPYYGVRAPCDDAPASILSRCRAYAPRLRPGQYFSHETAAALWELPFRSRVCEAQVLDVAADAAVAQPPRTRGVRGHSSRDRDVRVTRLHGLPVEDVVSAWVHLAGRIEPGELVVAGDAAVFEPRYRDAGDRRPLTTTTALRARLRGYRGRGKRALVAAIDLVREGVESPMETRLRLLLVAHGLPEPRVNVDLFDADRRFVGRADLYYPDSRVVVEYDGEQHRLDRAVYLADQKRIARLRKICSDVIRVTVDGLGPTAPATVATVRAALADAAPKPRSSSL